MSKKNNVNPNFYKVGGREHSEGSDKGIPQDLEKQKLENANKQREKEAGEKKSGK